MKFLIKALLGAALVYCLVHRDEFFPRQSARSDSAPAKGERRRVATPGRQSDLELLKAETLAKFTDGAREHCLASPHECAEVLKLIAAQASKRDAAGSDRR